MIAAWFNPHAKRVTPKRLALFRQTLPHAQIHLAGTPKEARQHAAAIAKDPPRLLLCGGGDGTSVVLLNALRAAGMKKFPTIGLLKLGTGNGWTSAVGARRFEKELVDLPRLPEAPPIKEFHLCEVEGRLCHFAGVGWDATLLNDYQRNLEARQAQILAGGLAAKLSKGLGGYLYSLFRITVPEEVLRARDGRTMLKLENLGEPALTFDGRGQRIEVPNSQRLLYDGPMSIGAAGTEPYWGSAFKAFPHAQAVPGRLNFRVYDRHVLVGINNMFHLWKGAPLPGMHDWWVKGVRLHLSRPMPFQVGGDVIGTREVVDFKLALETVDLVDWAAAAQQRAKR